MDSTLFECQLNLGGGQRNLILEKMVRTPEQLRQDLLVLEAQRGDPVALEQLVCLWQTRLWSLAMAHSDSSDAAWDVSQEAWLQILRGLRRLRQVEAFGRWASKIVTSVAAQRIRRHQVHSRAIETIANKPEIADASGDTQFERSVLSELPTSQREVIILHYFEDLEVAEIAEMLDIPAGTVKSRLHYARKKLQNLLGDDHGKESREQEQSCH